MTGILGEESAALEIASGRGQHAVWFAAAMRKWNWQPTDADARMLPEMASRIAEAVLPNLRAPLLLDVMASRWPSEGSVFAAGPEEEKQLDAIFCANMLHISLQGRP